MCRSSRNPNVGRPSYKEEPDSEDEIRPKILTKEEKPYAEAEKPKSKSKTKEDTPRKRKSTSDPVASNEEAAPAPKKKIKRLERKVVSNDEAKLSTEELMETSTYQRFTRLLEHIFDATEDADLNAPADLDDIAEAPQEAIIPKQQLHDLCAEAAKLKVSYHFMSFLCFG